MFALKKIGVKHLNSSNLCRFVGNLISRDMRNAPLAPYEVLDWDCPPEIHDHRMEKYLLPEAVCRRRLAKIKKYERINMKKLALIALGASALSMFSGCASSDPRGVAFMDLRLPVTATSSSVDVSKMKKGVSQCKSYVGFVAIGDASIETAMKNGGIKTVHAIDWKVRNILGLIGEYECIVYGE